MSYLTEYQKWLDSPALSDAERSELAAIKDNDGEIKSRFRNGRNIIAVGSVGNFLRCHAENVTSRDVLRDKSYRPYRRIIR